MNLLEAASGILANKIHNTPNHKRPYFASGRQVLRVCSGLAGRNERKIDLGGMIGVVQ